MSGTRARDHGSGTRARDHGTETKLRLVSWNVHGVPGTARREERMALISRAVAARRPDLVLLQEVWRQQDADAFVATLGPAGYAAVEAPDGGRWPLRTSGLLGFVRAASGWRAVRVRFHEFRAEAGDWKLWEGDGFGDKGALGFTLSRDAFELGIWNTHLQAAYEDGGYAAVRRAQLVELREVVGARDGAALVAGDLNTTPDEAAFGELAGLRELSAVARAACGCGTALHEPPRAEWLDYLLAKAPAGWRIDADVSLIKSLAPDAPYSDHHGLDAVVRVTPPPDPVALGWLAAARLAEPTTRRELLAGAALWVLGG